MADSKSLASELSILSVRLIRWLRAADEAPSLSGPQASVMAAIVASGRISPSELAELERVRRPTITRLVDELVARGLVRREPHPTDRRGSLLTATDEGLALWRAGQLRVTAPLAERIDALAPEEARQLADLLPLLRRLFDPPRP
jgi:DNA-binding MarR family transcriptional regulator